MNDIVEIVARLRTQHIEVAQLAADAVERLVESEAEARAALAEMQTQCEQLLAQLDDTAASSGADRKRASA